MAASSSQLVQCLRQIRTAEQLTQKRFAELVGISGQTVKNYESTQRGIGSGVLLKVTNHPRFKKYALWLTTGEQLPERGQIKPLNPKQD